MGQVHLTRHIDASADRVFDLTTNPASLRAWLRPMKELKHASGSLDEVGATLRAIISIGGHDLDTIWRVTRIEPGRFLHLSSSSLDGEADLLIECGAWYGACEVNVELTYELPHRFAGEMLDRLFADGSIRRDLRKSLEELERMCTSSLV